MHLALTPVLRAWMEIGQFPGGGGGGAGSPGISRKQVVPEKSVSKQHSSYTLFSPLAFS